MSVTVEGPPPDARHVKRVWVLRGLIPDRAAERHGTVRAAWDRLLEDRWVVGYLHDGSWWVDVRDGRGGLVEQVLPAAPREDAVPALHATVKRLLAEGAASAGRWIPAPGREFRRAAS